MVQRVGSTLILRLLLSSMLISFFALTAPNTLAASLTIEAKQGDARVTLLNVDKTYRDGIELAPGTYHVLVEKRGFAPGVFWIDLGDEDQGLEADLTARDNSALQKGWDKYVIGLKTYYGKGVAKSTDKARDWFKKAAAVGIPRAPAAIRLIDSGQPLDKTVVDAVPQEQPPASEYRGNKSVLMVRTDPPDARVRIMDIIPPYRDGIELTPGRHHLRVEREGYHRVDEWIELERGEWLFEVQLQPIGQPAASAPAADAQSGSSPVNEAVLYELAVVAQTVGRALAAQAIEAHEDQEETAKRQIGEGCIRNAEQEAANVGNAEVIYDVARRNCLAAGMILYNETYPPQADTAQSTDQTENANQE